MTLSDYEVVVCSTSFTSLHAAVITHNKRGSGSVVARMHGAKHDKDSR